MVHRPRQLSVISGALPIVLLAVRVATAAWLLVRRDRRHLVRTVPVPVHTSSGADPRTGHADLHADVREETTMSPNRDDNVDPAAPEEDTDHGHAPGDLAGLVDDLEERIIAERRSSGVAGNADERTQATPTENEDHAPE